MKNRRRTLGRRVTALGKSAAVITHHMPAVLRAIATNRFNLSKAVTYPVRTVLTVPIV